MAATTRELFGESVLLANWPAPTCVRACTTLRGPAGHSQPPFDRLNLGVRCGDESASSLRNRSELIVHLGLPSPPHWLQQVHGSGTVAFDRPPSSTEVDVSDPAPAEPVADAAVTKAPGVVLVVLTADCLPVLFCSDDGSAIGAAHAGWRGLAAGVLECNAEAMRFAPERLHAWLGPAAGPQAYEVGEEVRAAFVDNDPHAASAFVSTRPGHWLCDLYALARLRLADIGIASVHGGGLCTISDPQRFFSHRRDGRTGRMATLIHIE